MTKLRKTTKSMPGYSLMMKSVFSHFSEIQDRSARLPRYLSLCLVICNIGLRLIFSASLRYVAIDSLLLSPFIATIAASIALCIPILTVIGSISHIRKIFVREGYRYGRYYFSTHSMRDNNMDMLSILYLFNLLILWPVFTSYMFVAFRFPEQLKTTGLNPSQTRSTGFVFMISFIASIACWLVYWMSIITRRPSVQFMSNSSSFNLATISLTLCLDFIMNSICNNLQSTASSTTITIAIVKAALPIMAIIGNMVYGIFYWRYGLALFNSFFMAVAIFNLRMILEARNASQLVLSMVSVVILLLAPVWFRISLQIDRKLKTRVLEDFTRGEVTEKTHAVAISEFKNPSKERDLLMYGIIQRLKKGSMRKSFNECLEKFCRDQNDPNQLFCALVLFIFKRLDAQGKDICTPHIVINQLFFIVDNNFNMYHISLLINRLRNYSVSWSAQYRLFCLEQALSVSLEERHFGRQGLFKENYENKNFAVTQSGKKEFYDYLNSSILFDKLTSAISSTCAKVTFYMDEIMKTKVDLEYIHKLTEKVNNIKSMVQCIFNELEVSSDYKKSNYISAYAAYVKLVHGDQLKARQLLKTKAMRLKISSLSDMAQEKIFKTVVKFGENFVTMLLESDIDKIGQVIRVSRNCVQVFGRTYDQLIGTDVSSWLAKDFQVLHRELMVRFAKDMNIEYLGLFSKRFVTFDQKVFHYMTNVVKISCDITHGFRFSMGMHKIENPDAFLVIDKNGSFLGASQSAFVVFPKLNTHISKGLAFYSTVLENIREKVMLSDLYDLFMSKPTDELRSMLQHIKACNTHFKSIKAEASKAKSEGKAVHMFSKINTIEGDIGSSRMKVRYESEMLSETYGLHYMTIIFCTVALKVRLMNNHNYSDSSDGHDEPTESDLVQKRLTSGVMEKMRDIYHPNLMDQLCHVDLNEPMTPGLALSVNEVERHTPKEAPRDLNRKTKPYMGILKAPVDLISKQSRASVNTMTKKILDVSISRKFKRYGLLEILIFLFIQIIFTGLTTVSLVRMNYVQNSVMLNLIEFRYFIYLMINSGEKACSSIIATYEHMLQTRSLLPTSRFTHISKYMVYDPVQLVHEKLREHGQIDLQVRKFILNFDKSLSSKLYKDNSDFKFSYGPGDGKSGVFDLSSTDTIMMTYRYMYSVGDMLHNNQTLDFNSKFMLEAEFSASDDLYSKNLVKTINLLIVEDVTEYQKLQENIDLLIGLNLGAALVLLLLIILLVWIIKSKIVKIYKCFLYLDISEVKHHKDQLKSLDTYVKKLHFESDKVKQDEYDHVATALLLPSMSTGIFRITQNATNIRSRKMTSSALSSFGLNRSFSYFLVVIVVVGFLMFYFKGVLVKVNQNELDMLLHNRQYGRVIYTGYSMMLKLYGAILTRAGLKTPDAKFEGYLKYTEKLLENYNLNLGKVLLFIKSHPSETSYGFELLEYPGCNFTDYERYNISIDDCHRLAGNTMGVSMISMHQWVGQNIQSIIEQLRITDSQNQLATLTSETFEHLDYLTTFAAMPYFRMFTENFYTQLRSYHHSAVVALIWRLGIAVSVTFAVSFIWSLLSSVYIWMHIRTAEKSLDLIPAQSTRDNVYLKAALDKVGIF